jgi:hypothetical protein
VVLKLCRKHGTYLGRCTSCKVEDNQRRHRKEQAQGRRTLHWQKVRRDALARDGWVCRLKVDDDCTVRATTVHLDPKLKGKHQLAEVGGVVSACLHCHGVVDGRTTPHGGEGSRREFIRASLAPASHPRKTLGSELPEKQTRLVPRASGPHEIVYTCGY